MLVKNLSRRPIDFKLVGRNPDKTRKTATLRPGEEEDLDILNPESPTNKARVAAGVISIEEGKKTARKTAASAPATPKGE